VAVINGQVYAGSDKGLGMSRVAAIATPAPLQLNSNAVSLDGSVGSEETEGDPWTWAYYYGPRCLPSNSVLSIIPDISSSGGRSVLVVTDAGLAYLRAEPMTLQEKAKAVQSFQYPRHDRHGIVSAVSLDEWGDLSSYHKTTSDNDGLWTGMSTIGLTYRYMHSLKGCTGDGPGDGTGDGTGDEEARAMAWAGFEAMEQLSTISGA
jgi:hypothetical protein